MRASSRLFTLICRAVGLARQTSVLQVATMYTVVQNGPIQKNVRIVDYRSDTLSKPTKAMRQAMFDAEVGDDGYLEDPTVLALEFKIAVVLGKEAALFVPSGTMANLLAILTHCDRRGCEIIAGSESHILLWEQAGAAMIGGVQVRTVTNRADGTFDLDEMARLVRTQYRLCFEPMTRLICVENTHNKLGGRVLPLAWLHKLGARARAMGVALHMDGARLFNAAISSGVPVTTIVRDFDSVSICLSKGLGAPVGSLLIGPAAFILSVVLNMDRVTI